jgi:hypothetical protein
MTRSTITLKFNLLSWGIHSNSLQAGWSRDRNPLEEEEGGFKIFCNLPDQPRSPPSLLYNGYCVFPGAKWPGRGFDH